MYEILGLKHVFSTFQESVWSHLKSPPFRQLDSLYLGLRISLLDSGTSAGSAHAQCTLTRKYVNTNSFWKAEINYKTGLVLSIVLYCFVCEKSEAIINKRLLLE